MRINVLKRALAFQRFLCGWRTARQLSVRTPEKFPENFQQLSGGKKFERV
jgi:hypothetical protein